jgi:hypothetical protein
MELGGEFEKDIAEAYEYWLDQRPDGQEPPVTMVRWVKELLRKPIYELIGLKRMNED